MKKQRRVALNFILPKERGGGKEKRRRYFAICFFPSKAISLAQ